MKDLALLVLERAPKSEKEALLLLLRGDLGSGKTTFVQALAKELGVESRVTSPTFVIQKEYSIRTSGTNADPSFADAREFARLFHIDAHRLDSLTDLELLGWGQYSLDPGAIIALEWPERVPGVENHTRRLELTFSHVDKRTREVCLNGEG